MNLQSNWTGKITILFLAFFVIFNTNAIIFANISLKSKNPPLDYSNVNEIYASVAPMTIMHNEDDSSGTLINKIMTNYGP